MKKTITFFFIFVFALALVGCTGTESGNGGLNQIKVKGDTSIKVGETKKYEVEFDPSDYADKGVKWSSSDEQALTVDQDGNATGVKAKSSVYLIAASTKDETKKGQKKISVKDASSSGNDDYPDLGGYKISIAQAEHALGDIDPFNDGYTQADKEFKKQAWEEVEELFNCEIAVEAYPASAPWGPSRWSYIKNQAALNTADYDFYTVPDSQIPDFVDNGALIDISDFYVLYGNEMMDESFKTAGSYQNKLYRLASGSNNIYAVLYYNINLYEKLKEKDPTLKEPAELFLEGNWSFKTFTEYVVQVQDAMAILYGNKGTAGHDEQEYYAVSGWAPYYWAGLASNDGEPLADVKTCTINIGSKNKEAAADTVKTIYNSGCADPTQSVDGSVASWNEGKSFFNTGDLWFVGDSTRWPKNAWGDDTKYGYVPWPSAQTQSADDYRPALGSTSGWVMPIGRDYSGYGEDCTAENIFWAVALMFQKAEQYYKGSASYDETLALQTIAARYAHSQASQQAYIKVQELIKDNKAYFDPLVLEDNPITSYYTSGETLRTAVTTYVTGTDSWSAAIIDLVPKLESNLRKAYS